MGRGGGPWRDREWTVGKTVWTVWGEQGGDGHGHGEVRSNRGSSTHSEAMADAKDGPGMEEDPFSKEDFDAASYVSHALRRSGAEGIESERKRLERVAKQAEEDVERIVAEHREALLERVRVVEEAEKEAQELRRNALALQRSAQRAKAELRAPCDQAEEYSRQAKHLGEALEILRWVMRRKKLSDKLKVQLRGGKVAEDEGELEEADATDPAQTKTDSIGVVDLPKAARLFREIQQAAEEFDLGGIRVVEEDERWMGQAGSTIKSQAEKMLQQGMETLSLTDVGTALLVYANLGELQDAVEGQLNRCGRAVAQATSNWLDLSMVRTAGAADVGARAKASATAGTEEWQESFWKQLQEFTDKVQESMYAVWFLYMVMCRRKDPISRALLIEELPEGKASECTLCLKFQDKICTIVSAKLEKSMRSSQVRDVLLTNYAKVLQVLRTGLDKLQKSTRNKGLSTALAAQRVDQILLDMTKPVQTAYVARVLSRLNEAVRVQLPQNLRPGQQLGTPQQFTGRVMHEIHAASSNGVLLEMVGDSIAKTLHLLFERAEMSIATSVDLGEMDEICNPAQARNIDVCNFVQGVEFELGRFFEGLPLRTASRMQSSLKVARSIAETAVAPVFEGIMQAMEGRILKMHMEFANANGDGVGEGKGRGQYMEELLSLMQLVQSELLSKFVPAPSPEHETVASHQVERIASRTLLLFVRNATLVRPLSETARLTLAQDVAELELGVGSQLWPVEDMPIYPALKALKTLLFTETSALGGSTVLQDMPRIHVLHHLFSRAPLELQSPYARMGLPASKFNAWLDEHTEDDAMEAVRESLSAYSSLQGGMAFDPVYLVLQKLSSTGSN